MEKGAVPSVVTAPGALVPAFDPAPAELAVEAAPDGAKRVA
jgi:hypothetical protein